MGENKNSKNQTELHLKKKIQKPIAPTVFTVKKAFEKYPTMNTRGWNDELIANLVDNDLIGGFHQDNGELMIIEESLLAFIDYHNGFLERRNLAIKDNVAVLEDNKRIKNNS